MKKVLVVVAALMMVASGAFAQGLGITVADTAAADEVGALTVNAGVTIGMGDMEGTLFGARVEYGVIDCVSVLVGVGLADLDFADDAVIGIDIAVQYALPDMPVDLAVRAGYSRVVPETVAGMEIDLSSINCLLICSSEIEAVEGLAIYGGVGYWLALDDDFADSEIILAIGGQMALPVENLSVYVEYEILDEGFLAAGATLAF